MEREQCLTNRARQEIHNPRTSPADVQRLCETEIGPLTATQEGLSTWEPTEDEFFTHYTCVQKNETFLRNFNKALEDANSHLRQYGSLQQGDTGPAAETAHQQDCVILHLSEDHDPTSDRYIPLLFTDELNGDEDRIILGNFVACCYQQRSTQLPYLISRAMLRRHDLSDDIIDRLHEKYTVFVEALARVRALLQEAETQRVLRPSPSTDGESVLLREWESDFKWGQDWEETEFITQLRMPRCLVGVEWGRFSVFCDS